MGRTRQLVVAGALALAAASCGDVVRQGRAPVMLVVNSLQAAQGNHNSQFLGSLNSDVLTIVTQPAPCSTTSPCPTVFNDVGQAVFSLAMKDIGTPGNSTAPTTNNAVTITRYHVQYVRADGRNTPGVDVPYPFDGAMTITVAGTSAATVAFELVRVAAKEESPLVQLIGSKVVITALAQVTFYGTDQVGNAISATGNLQIDFGNFGDQ